MGEVGSAAKPAAGSADAPASSAASDTSIEVVLRLGTPDGLHARPAAQLMEMVAAADATLTVTNPRSGATADGGSMLELMALDARPGDRLRLVVSGPDAAGVVAAAITLLTGQATERPCG